MALEESRASTHERATDRSQLSLRGTEDLALDGVESRWALTLERLTLERETRASARVEAAVRRLGQDATVAGIDPTWLGFLAETMQVCAFTSQAMHDVLERAALDCRWGPVARAIDTEAALLLRQAQAVVLYAMDLESIMGEMPLEGARARWEAGRAWAPARRLLAQLARRDDWGEIVVAVNVCVEPLVGQLMRREWASRIAAELGDATTPVLAEPALEHQEWVQEWTVEMLDTARRHPDHGDDNHATVAAWVRRWTPPAREAAEAMTSLTAELSDPAAGTRALERCLADQRDLVALLGLPDGTPA